MIKEKNRVMLFITTSILVLSFVVHILHRFIGGLMGHEVEMTHSWVDSLTVNLLLVIPAVAVIAAFFFSRLSGDHRWIPLLNTLSLTFSSISIIAGGKGMVEYHFSIFIVLAIIVYYESIVLLLTSTTIFALHHLLGFFLFPELVYGAESYPFYMVSIHLLFVILFIGAVIYQIVTRRKVIKSFEQNQDQKLKQTVKGIIDNITATSEEVLTNSRVLSGNSTQLSQLTTGVAEIMRQLDEAANLQEHGAETSRQTVSGMLEDTYKIAEISAKVSEISDDAAGEAEKGNQSIQQAVHQMKSMSAAVQDSALKVKLLAESTHEINQIVNLITDIAAQTNLLALNAAIEAARAGEQGRGFTVVSNEVRKLSEQTSESAQQIATLIQDIQKNNHASMESMDQVIAKVKQGGDAVMAAGFAFERILKSVQAVALQIRQISGASQQMSESTQKFSASVDDFTDLSMQLMNSVKTVTSSSFEQHDLIKKSSELAIILEMLSDKLNEIMVDTKRSFSLT